MQTGRGANPPVASSPQTTQSCSQSPPCITGPTPDGLYSVQRGQNTFGEKKSERIFMEIPAVASTLRVFHKAGWRLPRREEIAAPRERRTIQIAHFYWLKNSSVKQKWPKRGLEQINFRPLGRPPHHYRHQGVRVKKLSLVKFSKLNANKCNFSLFRGILSYFWGVFQYFWSVKFRCEQI